MPRPSDTSDSLVALAQDLLANLFGGSLDEPFLAAKAPKNRLNANPVRSATSSSDTSWSKDRSMWNPIAVTKT